MPKPMRNIQVIKEKDAVLVPMKEWERVQSEIVRLRRKVKKAQILQEIRDSVLSLKADLDRPPHLRKFKMTAEELFAELKNGK
ncbi:MAG: hypothetical protein IT174_06745 [Acidobacteria bacterium]|nr:hypothetical protein [Acidobacteriota bacterium]